MDGGYLQEIIPEQPLIIIKRKESINILQMIYAATKSQSDLLRSGQTQVIFQGTTKTHLQNCINFAKRTSS